MIKNKTFSEKTINPNPFLQFGIWYKERLGAGIEIPESVSLGTASPDGRVSIRTVLMKSFDENGFIFFTNYTSRKGKQLFSNQNAALHFYWAEAGRQVRIEGVTTRLTEEESHSYFKTRPRESQLSAWASDQSSVIPDRQYLEIRYEFFLKKYQNLPVEKPPFWGGFRLIPDWFEFWQNGAFRLHDRITYSKANESWIIERLAP